MSGHQHYVTPFVLPVVAFLGAIGAGSCLLSLDICAAGDPMHFVDALFTATSAVCVTGLASADVFAVFNRTGQCVVLALIQLGGLGIVTYTTLIFYILGKRISLRDRLAVEQSLFYDPSFNLGRFLQQMVCVVLVCEALGAAALHFFDPGRIGIFEAVFVSVSAFCNAGFAPWPESLIPWRDNWGVNLSVMSLIIVGGLGYFVLFDTARVVEAKIRRLLRGQRSLYPGQGDFDGSPLPRLSYFSRVVLSTTLFLILAGTVAILLLETGNAIWRDTSVSERFLIALFQSVTSRTAGFATVDMALFSDAALLLTIALMFIGGSPGSCAGGIKTTTFRIMVGSLMAQLRGHGQTIVAGRAVMGRVCNKAMLLFCYALLTILAATFALVLTENGTAHHDIAPFRFLDLLFETVSAFATVGLSINITPRLSSAGKIILCFVMFIGKLGPVWLITTIQQFQSEPAYRYPEDSIPVG